MRKLRARRHYFGLEPLTLPKGSRAAGHRNHLLKTGWNLRVVKALEWLSRRSLHTPQHFTVCGGDLERTDAARAIGREEVSASLGRTIFRVHPDGDNKDAS